MGSTKAPRAAGAPAVLTATDRSSNSSASPSSDVDFSALQRAALTVPQTLLPQFAAIRGHLVANATSITRDETIVREVLKLLLCKIYDERSGDENDPPAFAIRQADTADTLTRRITEQLLRPLAKTRVLKYPEHLEWNPSFRLDADSIWFVVKTLQPFALSLAARDIIGQGFEALIGTSLRGEEGQFFTPKNLTRLMVSMAAPQAGEVMLDPACGTGGFLVSSIQYASQHVNGDGRGSLRTVGIEKDEFLFTVAEAYLSIIDEHNSAVYSADALRPPNSWSYEMRERCSLDSFDVIITNPPFGARIPVRGTDTLSQYALARGKTKAGGLAEYRPPQILFIERCLQFLKPGGRLAIVVPDGMLGNESERYVRDFIFENCRVRAIVDCPLETFMPSTPTKTSVLLVEKGAPRNKDYPVFMAVAKTCGHDRRGRPLHLDDGSVNDDFATIAARFDQWRKAQR
jgi:type I restriction enzyme M protein